MFIYFSIFNFLVLSFVFFCVRFYFFCLEFVLYSVYDFIINK